MREKRFISKDLAVKLFLFFAVITAAILFDVFHEDNSVDYSDSKQETPKSDDSSITHFYFCNSAKPLNLKIPGSHDSKKNLFQNQDKFLQKFHNKRAFYILKTESKLPRLPIALAVHYTVLKKCHYSSPDDYPPVG